MINLKTVATLIAISIGPQSYAGVLLPAGDTCSVVAGDNQAFAAIASPAGNFFCAAAAASAGGNGFSLVGSFASSDAETAAFYTEGPVRSGLLRMHGNWDAEGSFGWSARSNFSVGSYSAGPLPFGVPPNSIPFTLGVPFQVSVGASASAYCPLSSVGPCGGGGARVDIEMSLYEADGFTPVTIDPTPEPPTSILAGVIGVLLSLRVPSMSFLRIRRAQGVLFS